jgi:hypothetical protein
LLCEVDRQSRANKDSSISIRVMTFNIEWGWPLAPGNYVIRLMKDDGYESLAESAMLRID